MYEALRAYFVEGRPSAEVAHDFNYSPGSFQVLCHHFRRDPEPIFFVSPRPGPRSQPKKSAARDLVVRLRKQNHSVYEISEALKEQNCPLSPTAVQEVLKAEGFAPLQVSFHRRSHLPILLASVLLDKPVAVPWWNGLKLRLTTYNGPSHPKS